MFVFVGVLGMKCGGVTMNLISCYVLFGVPVFVITMLVSLSWFFAVSSEFVFVSFVASVFLSLVIPLFIFLLWKWVSYLGEKGMFDEL